MADVILITACSVVALLGLWGLRTHSFLARRQRDLEVRWASVDIQLRRRHSIVPALVRTVEGYVPRETVEPARVAEAHVGATAAAGLQEHSAAERRLSATLARTLALTKRYPDLAAAQAYRSLETELRNTERDLETASREYRRENSAHNDAIERFPTRVIARICGFRPRPLAAAFDPGRATPLEVSLNRRAPKGSSQDAISRRESLL